MGPYYLDFYSVSKVNVICFAQSPRLWQLFGNERTRGILCFGRSLTSEEQAQLRNKLETNYKHIKSVKECHSKLETFYQVGFGKGSPGSKG